MIRFKLGIIFCFISIFSQATDQQLLMFLHMQSQSFGDEEGLNVAHQALTAIIQQAAPILMSENIWQHVVERKDRFKQGLQKKHLMQHAVVAIHKNVNDLLKNNKSDVSIVNQFCNQDWYQKQYFQLSQLDQYSYKHLLFDYFCYYIFEYFQNWKIYQLPEGYLLWIPYDKHHGFNLENLKVKSKFDLAKPNFLERPLELDQVLPIYIKNDKSIKWAFYATGHGLHKDFQQSKAEVCGMTLQSLKKVLKFFNDCISTKLFLYSSCFAAGQHSIIPYQDENKDLLLSYPVVIISLTDAPVYVFGDPSGLKLPPYSFENCLKNIHVDLQQLQPFSLQRFDEFCKYAQSGKIDKTLAKMINPYIQCTLSCCTILKIENVPLIRRAYSSFFIPLDEFSLHCITNSIDQVVELNDKDACLWYVNRYSGVIKILKKLPVFVSMIPGNQVHCGKLLHAQEFDFVNLVRTLFLSIDDIQEQNIYMFEKIFCSIMIPSISSKCLYELEHVLILPTGQWLPSFAQKGASCYVFAQAKDRFFCLFFDQNKQLSSVQELSNEQRVMMDRFKQLLFEQCAIGNNASISTVLSSEYFCQKNKLQKKMLHTCIQEKICK